MLSDLMNEDFIANLEFTESLEVVDMEYVPPTAQPADSIYALNCLGCFGTFGTAGACCGTFGTFGCLG